MILKINLARNAGFCFGVRRALDIALKTADSRRQVYMLGDIVHNEQVVKTIERAGIRKINRLFPGKGKTLLVRAHGISTDTIREAKGLKFRVIDATCPMVKEIHKIARGMEKKGYR
ncbi:bifunctional 4-hydroxy-3-methylbut-2-enyl diphosphate reductase/30S ribosomal protein S1, partial [Candidatus Omnitrophota bacterium]